MWLCRCLLIKYQTKAATRIGFGSVPDWINYASSLVVTMLKGLIIILATGHLKNASDLTNLLTLGVFASNAFGKYRHHWQCSWSRGPYHPMRQLSPREIRLPTRQVLLSVSSCWVTDWSRSPAPCGSRRTQRSCSSGALTGQWCAHRSSGLRSLDINDKPTLHARKNTIVSRIS